MLPLLLRPRARQAIADVVDDGTAATAAHAAVQKPTVTPESREYSMEWSKMVTLDDCHAFQGFAFYSKAEETSTSEREPQHCVVMLE